MMEVNSRDVLARCWCADLVCCECGNDTVMAGWTHCTQCAEDGFDPAPLDCDCSPMSP